MTVRAEHTRRALDHRDILACRFDEMFDADLDLTVARHRDDCEHCAQRAAGLAEVVALERIAEAAETNIIRGALKDLDQALAAFRALTGDKA